MKKMTQRAIAVLLLASAVICGMIVYVIRYVDEGRDWALYFARSNTRSSGRLLDRNGYDLAYFTGYENLFSDDAQTRTANYHVTGDYWGRTGAGVLQRYWSKMQSFDLINGTTREEHSVMQLNIDSYLNRIIYLSLNRLEKPLPKGVEPMPLLDDFGFPVLDEEGREVFPEPEKCNGAVLICNYMTGELLGLVSTPSVDPMDDVTPPADGAYINRCLSASFIPGSVFKLITAAAAIENLPEIYDMSFYCEGSTLIAGVPVTCMAAHGTQNFDQTLANSCNCAYAKIAIMLGQDTLARYVRSYGFLDRQSLGDISTAAGSFPLEFVGDPELGWAGIGQSTDLICPYNMLRFVCAIANEGVVKEPKIVRDGYAPTETRLIEAETARRLKEMMAYNVSYGYDGANMFAGLPAMCAKTGTAELGDGTTHAWFVGFLDDAERPWAFVTFVEQGGSGLSVAGGLTKSILKQYISGTS